MLEDIKQTVYLYSNDCELTCIDKVLTVSRMSKVDYQNKVVANILHFYIYILVL